MEFQKFGAEKLLEGMLNLGIRVELETEYINQIPPCKTLVYKWRRINSFPLEFILGNHNQLLGNITHLKSGNGSAHSRIKIPKRFDNRLAYLLGAMRDGSLIYCCRKHFVRVYDTSDAIWISKVKDVFHEVFDVEMHLRYQKTSNVAYLDISSKPLFHLLRSLFEGHIHKGVPEIIRTAPTWIQKAYIEGFFDAEGHVPHKVGRNQIDFTQKDKESLEFVKAFLENFGIECGKISTHRLPIYGKQNIEKFYNDFKILNLPKLKRLEMLLEVT